MRAVDCGDAGEAREVQDEAAGSFQNRGVDMPDAIDNLFSLVGHKALSIDRVLKAFRKSTLEGRVDAARLHDALRKARAWQHTKMSQMRVPQLLSQLKEWDWWLPDKQKLAEAWARTAPAGKPFPKISRSWAGGEYIPELNRIAADGGGTLGHELGHASSRTLGRYLDDAANMVAEEIKANRLGRPYWKAMGKDPEKTMKLIFSMDPAEAIKTANLQGLMELRWNRIIRMARRLPPPFPRTYSERSILKDLVHPTRWATALSELTGKIVPYRYELSRPTALYPGMERTLRNIKGVSTDVVARILPAAKRILPAAKGILPIARVGLRFAGPAAFIPDALNFGKGFGSLETQAAPATSVSQFMSPFGKVGAMLRTGLDTYGQARQAARQMSMAEKAKAGGQIGKEFVQSLWRGDM